MRNVQVRFAVGDARPASHLEAYGPASDGVLEPATPAPAGRGFIHDHAERPGWLESAWLTGPWLGPRRSAGWLRSAWLTQPWLAEVAEVPVSIGQFEYGVIEGAAKVADAVENISSMSPTGSVLVNASPPPPRTTEISVASDVVTLTVALQVE